MSDFELRSIRADLYETPGEEWTLSGYASVFGDWADIGGRFRERFMPGAFEQTLQERDVVALWNHEDGKPLARLSKGTLELREDPHGLFTKIRLNPETGYHRDAYAAVRDGLVEGMSIRFSVPRSGEKTERDEAGTMCRTVNACTLFEVSPVTFPAYTGTNVGARAQVFMDRIEADETRERRIKQLHLVDAALMNIRGE